LPWSYHQDLSKDQLSREDWDDIKEEAAALRPFKVLTVELQSRATSGNHGSVWETLPALELLLEHMESMKQRLTGSDTRLAQSVNSCWNVLTKYYNLTDRNQTVYAMGTLLNPTCRSAYFTRHWTGQLASYIPTMKTACHGRWQREYQSKIPSATIPRKRTLLEAFLHQDPSEEAEDEWERWVSALPIPITAQSDNLFRWHVDNQESFPTLHQMALDTLSIPAMSTECERVFSSTKKLLSPQRCRIKEDLMEATECLKAWWDCGIIEQ
jgi:hAT family C-terminal dimerisation region